MRSFGAFLIGLGLLLGVTVIGLVPGAILVIIGLLCMIAARSPQRVSYYDHPDRPRNEPREWVKLITGTRSTTLPCVRNDGFSLQEPIAATLALKGIRVIGLQAHAEGGSFQKSTARIVVNNNGHCQIWTYDELVEAAR